MTQLARYLARTETSTQGFATRCGVTKMTVWRWANGWRVPDWDMQQRIAKLTDGDVVKWAGKGSRG